MELGFMQGRLVKSEKKNKIQYFPSKSWKKELKIAKNIKYINNIEWTVNYENILENPMFDKTKLNYISKELKKNKIKMNSVTCDFFMEKPFFKKEIDLKKINLLIEIIKNGIIIGIKYFIVPLVDQSSINNMKQEKKLISMFKKEIIPLLKKSKSMVLFEMDYKPKLIIPFIKKFKSNRVGINYDTGNSASLGYDLLQELKYFKYVKNIHIKDRKLFGTTVRLGEGNVDFKKFFKLLHSKNYKGNLILQTARSKNNRHTLELKKNINFIKNYI